MGSILVSVCRCWVFVSCVHPVASLKHVFCIVCSFVVFVGFMIGDHMVLAYSIVGRVIVLYVFSNVSFVLPQCVVVRAFIILVVLLAFVVVFCMCLVYVSFGSKVSPRILGFLTVFSVVLFMFSVMV